MEVGLLGPLRVVSDDGVEVALAGRRRTLLAVLAIHLGEVVSADRLVETLWGDDLPDHPLNALQGRVSQLRKVIGRQSVRQRGSGYVLELPDDAIDARRFSAAAARAHTLLGEGRAAAAREILVEALDWWYGPALEEFLGASWADTEAHRLEECRLSALEDRIDADLVLGSAATLVAELDALVTTHQFRERFRGQLMLALYRSGRQAEALEVFDRGRALLSDELGLDPSTELQQLQSAILTQDPALLRLPSDGTATTTPIASPPVVPRRVPTIRVLVVDDDPLVRSAISSILSSDPGIEVVGEADDGLAAIDTARRLAPDVVLMDVRMPELDGIQATRQILADGRDTSVIVLTTFDQDENVVRAIEAGASGFLLKRTDPARLPDAVRTVARGDAIIDPAVTKQLLGTFLRGQEAPPESALHTQLATDERTVFELLADGRADAEIAVLLGLPDTLVEELVRGILEKLDVRDRTQAVVYAYKHQLVPS